MPERALRAEQRAGDAIGRSGRIHHAARIVRRVQDDQLRARRKRALESGKIGQHGLFVERNLNQTGAPILDEPPIRRVAGQKRDYFVLRVEHRLHKGINGACGPSGHNDIGSFVRGVEPARQRSGDGRTDIGIPGAVHIAVQFRRGFARGFFQRSAHARRARSRRIADAEIEDVVGTVSLLQLFGFLKSLANGRRCTETLLHEPRNEHFSFLLCATCARRTHPRRTAQEDTAASLRR